MIRKGPQFLNGRMAGPANQEHPACTVSEGQTDFILLRHLGLGFVREANITNSNDQKLLIPTPQRAWEKLWLGRGWAPGMGLKHEQGFIPREPGTYGQHCSPGLLGEPAVVTRMPRPCCVTQRTKTTLLPGRQA